MRTITGIMCMLFLTSSSLGAQEETLVLRRVFAGPPESAGVAVIPILRDIPRMLSSRLTSLEPIILVTDPAEAHSVIATAIEPAGENLVRVTIRLMEKETVVRSVSAEFSRLSPAPQLVKKFIDDAAREFAPAVGKVQPEIRLLTVTLDDKTKAKVEKIEFAEEMASGHELELWVGGIVKSPSGQGSEPASVYLNLPVMLSYTRYLDKYSGLSFHIYFEYSDVLAFSSYTIEPVKFKETSNNLFILPGVGWTVRSLGRLSTTFSLSLLAGAVRIEAVDPLSYYPLAPGEAVWAFISFFNLNLALCYNFTPAFSVRLRTGFSLNILGLISGILRADLGFLVDYEPDFAMLQYQLLNIGVSLRL